MTKNIEVEQTTITDQQIIEMYWLREERAIQETDIKYGKFLLRMAYNILHDQCDCEECQNDTYLGIWNTIPPTRPAVFPAFITQIMRNIAINRYKEKTSKKRIPSELQISMDDLNYALHSDISVEKEYEANEIGKIISEYIRGLSDRKQYIFVGRFYIADKIENIADELGISISSVYKEIEKIKQGLKIHLERNGVYL
ncbi:MAG: sigma-70 family RNA polymerase sigma factor [Clostridia bacterium]|nr:sigma-70 family RNA polymerase sigma factor [Clostridia bacterium]